MCSMPGGFEDIITRYWDIGISEFVIFYPSILSMELIFERILDEAVPSLRESLK